MIENMLTIFFAIIIAFMIIMIVLPVSKYYFFAEAINKFEQGKENHDKSSEEKEVHTNKSTSNQ